MRKGSLLSAVLVAAVFAGCGNMNPFSSSEFISVRLDSTSPVSKKVRAGETSVETTVLRVVSDRSITGLGLRINGNLPPWAITKVTAWEILKGMKIGEAVFTEGGGGVLTFSSPIAPTGDSLKLISLKVDLAKVPSYAVPNYHEKTFSVDLDGRVFFISYGDRRVYEASPTEASRHVFLAE